MPRRFVQRGAGAPLPHKRRLSLEPLESRSLLAAIGGIPDLGDAVSDDCLASAAIVTDVETPWVDDASKPPEQWTIDALTFDNADQGVAPDGDPGMLAIAPDDGATQGVPTDENGSLTPDSDAETGEPCAGDLDTGIPIEGCWIPEDYSLQVCPLPADAAGDGVAIDTFPVVGMAGADANAASFDPVLPPDAAATQDARQHSLADSARRFAAFAGAFASSSGAGQTDQPTGSGRRGPRR